MPKAKIAGTKSIKLELEPGVYYYCTCGESMNQPFCDGAHNSLTGESACFQPMEFTITEKKDYALCTCKLTEKPPFCDAAHKKLKC